MTVWLSRWRRNGFRTSTGSAVSNQKLICYIDALLNERRQAGQSVRFEHVRGHSGDPGNEAADGLANSGCTLPALEDKDWIALEEDVRTRTEDFNLLLQSFRRAWRGATLVGSFGEEVWWRLLVGN